MKRKNMDGFVVIKKSKSLSSMLLLHMVLFVISCVVKKNSHKSLLN